MGAPDTRNVLTPAARTIFETLVFLIVVALAAIEFYRWLSPQEARAGNAASAATAATSAAAAVTSASIETKVDAIANDVREIKDEQVHQSRDIAVIKRQLGLDGLGPPVRSSGIAR